MFDSSFGIRFSDSGSGVFESFSPALETPFSDETEPRPYPPLFPSVYLFLGAWRSPSDPRLRFISVRNAGRPRRSDIVPRRRAAVIVCIGIPEVKMNDGSHIKLFTRSEYQMKQYARHCSAPLHVCYSKTLEIKTARARAGPVNYWRRSARGRRFSSRGLPKDPFRRLFARASPAAYLFFCGRGGAAIEFSTYLRLLPEPQKKTSGGKIKYKNEISIIGKRNL